MPQTERPVSAVGGNYSNLFHCGLRAVSSHGRSMSAPVFGEVQPSSAASSLRSSLRASFWNRLTDPELEDSTSSWADVSSAAGSDSSSEASSKDSDVWSTKDLPLHLGLSRNSNRDSSVSIPSKLVSLDPLAPSPGPTSTSFFIELSESNSNTDSSPSFLQKDQEESFLCLSTSSESIPLHTRRHPISIQTMSLPSRHSSVFTPVEKIDGDFWLGEFDFESPSEFKQSRWDVLPQSAVDGEVYHYDRAEDDWRQFHADWIRDDKQIFSPPNSPTLGWTPHY